MINKEDAYGFASMLRVEYAKKLRRNAITACRDSISKSIIETDDDYGWQKWFYRKKHKKVCN